MDGCKHHIGKHYSNGLRSYEPTYETNWEASLKHDRTMAGEVLGLILEAVRSPIDLECEESNTTPIPEYTNTDCTLGLAN